METAAFQSLACAKVKFSKNNYKLILTTVMNVDLLLIRGAMVCLTKKGEGESFTAVKYL